MNMIPLICLVGAALVMETPAEPALRLVSETQQHMGTDFTIQLYAAEGEDPQPALQAAFAKIAELDGMMSDYNPESELSRLGATSPQRKPVTVSRELWEILNISKQVGYQTDGAFDVTVGPITRLWRQARRQKKLPDAGKLNEALASVGFKNMELSEPATDHVSGKTTVQLTKPQMRLDLGGIAQGYAAEAALKIIEEHGFRSAMVNASGDIVAGDPPPGQKGWKIGLVSLDPKLPPSEFAYLSHGALTNSGDAFQFTEVNGKRYSHIVDPKTGIGLTTRMSVTVWHPDGTMADAIDSAVCVLGPEKGVKLIESIPDCAALLIFATEDGAQVIRTKNFDRLAQVKGEDNGGRD